MRSVILILVAAVVGALSPTVALGQKSDPPCLRSGKCIEVNLQLLSVAAGYGANRMSSLTPTPDRAMRGLYLRTDVHILSLALRKLPIATYDALFLDLTYGKMTSKPLLFLNQAEDNTTLPFTFGYHFVAGVRRELFALMGGLGYQKYSLDMGGTSFTGSAVPVTARAEFGGRKPVVLMAWAAPGSKKMMGARIDLPFFRQLNLTAMYWRGDGTAEPWDRPQGTKVAAKANMLMVGVRTAEIR